MRSLRLRLNEFEWRVPGLGLARSGLALAQLSILLLNSDDVLFLDQPGGANPAGCQGVVEGTLWCLAGTDHQGAARAAAVAILLATVSGYRPAWTCVPHWYVSVSLSLDLVSRNGGDQAAQIVTLLLIPMLVGDRRMWIWQRPRVPAPALFQGGAFAAFCMLRLQASLIYFNAVVSKLLAPAWFAGTAMRPIAQHPYHGFPTAVMNRFEAILDWPPVVAGLTWGAIAVELAIAVLVLGSARWRLSALVLGIALHGGIALLMGLPTFGLIMICLLKLCYVGTSSLQIHPRSSEQALLADARLPT